MVSIFVTESASKNIFHCSGTRLSGVTLLFKVKEITAGHPNTEPEMLSSLVALRNYLVQARLTVLWSHHLLSDITRAEDKTEASMTIAYLKMSRPCLQCFQSLEKET